MCFIPPSPNSLPLSLKENHGLSFPAQLRKKRYTKFFFSLNAVRIVDKCRTFASVNGRFWNLIFSQCEHGLRWHPFNLKRRTRSLCQLIPWSPPRTNREACRWSAAACRCMVVFSIFDLPARPSPCSIACDFFSDLLQLYFITFKKFCGREMVFFMLLFFTVFMQWCNFEDVIGVLHGLWKDLQPV